MFFLFFFFVISISLATPIYAQQATQSLPVQSVPPTLSATSTAPVQPEPPTAATGTVPLQPAQTQPATAQSAQTAPEKPGKQTINIESADYMKYNREQKTTVLRGLVKVSTEDTTIEADEMTIDEKSNTVAAFGNITINDGTDTINGTALYYDNDKEYFEIAGARGTVVSDDIKGKLFYRGERAWGTRKKIRLHKGYITTCDPTCCRQEYHIMAKDLAIYPDIKIIAKKAYFYMGAYPVFFFPLYVVPLKQKREQYTPEFGYTKEEGFFVKNKYPYYASLAMVGYLLLDHMTKKGTGYGAEHTYTSKRLGGEGYSKFWTMNENDTGLVSTTIDQTQDFKIGGKTAGKLNYSRDNTYNIYQDRSRVNRTTLQFDIARTVNRMIAGEGPSTGTASAGAQKRRDSLSITHTEQYSITQNYNSSGTLSQQYYFSPNTNFSYNFLYTRAKSGFSNEDKEADFKTNFTKNTKAFNLSVTSDKRFDLDAEDFTGDNNYSVNTTLPEVVFALNDQMLKRLIPIKNDAKKPRLGFRVVHGRYREGVRNASYPIRRTDVDSEISRTFNLSKKATLTPTQKYEQLFYQTHDAKYVMTHNTAFNYRFNTASSLNLNFNRVSDAGGAPFRKDSIGESNMLSGAFNIQKQRTTFNVTSGYNYEIGKWQAVNLGYLRGITQHSSIDFKLGYDLDTSLWQTTVVTLKLGRKNMDMNIGTTWNTEKDMELTIAQITTQIRRRNGWHFDIRSVYEDTHPYPFIREWIATKTRKCTEVQFSYNAELEEYRLNYTILAFPSRHLGIYNGQQGLQLDQSSLQIPSSFGGAQQQY